MQIGMDISRIAVAARTGTEHYTYELLAALARRDRSNAYTLYANQPPAELPPLGPNMALRRIPFPRLWTHARLSAEVLARRPDVLFIPSHVVPPGAPLARVPSVVTVHDLGYLRFPEAHTRAQRLYLRLSTVWSARVARRVIAISGATRDDLVRLARIPAAKIDVIHHGVAPRFHPIADQDALRAVQARYGIDEPYLLYVGTVQPRKNLIRLIDAYADVARALGGAVPILAIGGKRGWLAEAIERRAAERDVSARVRLLGYVADADLPALLGGALAFVFPSLYEGFGMPVLEAMAAGTPVLTANTTALPEVAGDAALLVDPSDAGAIAVGLRRLVADAALRADLRARGLARSARFTWDACAAQTLDVLRRAGGC